MYCNMFAFPTFLSRFLFRYWSVCVKDSSSIHYFTNMICVVVLFQLISIIGIQAIKPADIDTVIAELVRKQHDQQMYIRHSVVTNIGNHYNLHNGMFTCPSYGVYGFSWTISVREYIGTQLVVNSEPVGAMYTTAYQVDDIRTTTGMVIVEVNTGDVVVCQSKFGSNSAS